MHAVSRAAQCYPREAVRTLLLLISACSAEVRLDLTGVDLDVAFLVAIAESGEVRAIGEPFEISDGRAVGPANIEIESSDRALVVGLSNDEILTLVPGYDQARKSQVTLEHDPSATISTSVVADPVRSRLPPSTRVFEIDEERGTLEPVPFERHPPVATLALEVPSNPEFCASDPPLVPRPFAAIREVFRDAPRELINPDNAESRRPIELIPLGRDRLIVATTAGVFLVDRNGLVDGLRSTALTPPASVRAVELDRRSDPPTLWIAGSESEGEGLVWQMAIDGDSLVPIGTVPLDSELDDVRDIALDPRGALVAVGGGGSIWLMREGESSFSPINSPTVVRMTKIALAANDDHPHLIGMKGSQAVFGDALAGRWDPAVVLTGSLIIGQDDDVLDVVASADGRELFAAGESSLVARWTPEDEWTVLDMPIPPSLSDCTNGESLFRFDLTMRSIAVTEESIFVAAEECSAFLRIERERLCLTPLSLGGPAERTETWNTVVRSDGDRLLLGGEWGAIHEVDL
jgi:hypothetical protein